MKQIKAILIGAGARGAKAYAPYALKNPEQIKFVAVAEPREIRRLKFQKDHNIKDENVFTTYEDVFEKNIEADVVFICTTDELHFEPTMMALEKGYNVVLEKPISNSLEECKTIQAKVEETGKTLIVCHVLRYTKFFNQLKKIIDSGEIGDIVSITHNENVGFWHSAHSYVRGNWAKEEVNPMLLAKSCHDIDILLWLIGKKCTKVSSFGSLKHFKKECAPEGSTDRCLNGCKVKETCPFDASKIYLDESVTEWPVNVITDDVSMENRIKALEEGPYGRCVYHCENDVVDHQVVIMEFENGVTANFSMNSFSYDISRYTTIYGTKGQLRGKMEENLIYKNIYLNHQEEEIYTLKPGESEYGHGGGDEGLMESVCSFFSGNGNAKLTTSRNAVEGHVICFEAEKARKENKVVLL